MRLTNSELMRDADDKAIHARGIPSTLLMTNAAKALTKTVLELMDKRASAQRAVSRGGGSPWNIEKGSVVIFCGSGNNGGDGIGASLYLLQRGISTRCFLVGEREKMSADTAEMERRLIELGGVLEDFIPGDADQKNAADEADVIIDALFGIGLNAALTRNSLAALKMINASRALVVSADIASGVLADTGSILSEAVKADVTVTFSMAKPGHFVEPGCTMCGELKIADIGLPAELLENAATDVFVVGLREPFTLPTLPQRCRVSHKGDYGRLLIIGGSVGYTGAPVLCATAAIRSGAGLVYLGVPREIYELTAGRLLEPMPFPLPDEDGKISAFALSVILERLKTADVCVIGCGLSRSLDISALVRRLLQEGGKKKPLVIDADGLFALGDKEEAIKSALTPPILTPHEGEFLRLGGKLTGDRLSDARNFAQSRNCHLVLKGHRTICAFPDGETYIINAGNPGMAKGGSGDVLAGIIGALLCQLPTKAAIITACFIHAHAGDICAERFGEYSMLPTDMIEAIPAAFGHLRGR